MLSVPLRPGHVVAYISCNILSTREAACFIYRPNLWLYQSRSLKLSINTISPAKPHAVTTPRLRNWNKIHAKICWNWTSLLHFCVLFSLQVSQGEISIVWAGALRVSGCAYSLWPWRRRGRRPGSWCCWLCWRWLMLPSSCLIRDWNLGSSETGATSAPTSSSSSPMTRTLNWVSEKKEYSDTFRIIYDKPPHFFFFLKLP